MSVKNTCKLVFHVVTSGSITKEYKIQHIPWDLVCLISWMHFTSKLRCGIQCKYLLLDVQSCLKYPLLSTSCCSRVRQDSFATSVKWIRMLMDSWNSIMLHHIGATIQRQRIKLIESHLEVKILKIGVCLWTRQVNSPYVLWDASQHGQWCPEHYSVPSTDDLNWASCVCRALRI